MAKESFRKMCPIARALDAIGEKWSLLIVRNLVLKGAQRFQDLEQGLPGIAPNTLSARLKTLEEHGAIARRFYAQHPPRCEYYLTERGEELRPVLKALRQWGETNT